METKSFVFRFADVEVREKEFTLIKAGKVLTVEPKAFRVLLFLLRSPQKLVAKEELLNSVWGDAAVTEGSLTRCIWLLRRMLEDDIHEPRYIATVATLGYRFICPVEVSEEMNARNWMETEQHEVGSAGVTIHANPQDMAVSGFRHWWLLSASVFVVGLCAGIWHLHRPLSLPRIMGYTQITHDGLRKYLVGVDASRLYVNGFSLNSIEQVRIAGGDLEQIPVKIPGGPGMMEDLSPDGANFLTATFEQGKRDLAIWNVPILGGSYHRLVRGVDAAYSPDGSSVVYSTGDDEIWLIRTDGTGAHRLASMGGIWPEWSPDGRVIRFSRDHRIWEISSDGSNLHQLLPGWNTSGSMCCGHWTPDENFYLFVSSESPKAGDQIWALDERRGPLRQPLSQPIQLTTGPIVWGAPFPSKDGKKLFSCGDKLRGELSRGDPATREIKPFLGGISADYVSFSKDGQLLAYASFPEGILWRAKRDGSNPVQLTEPLTLIGGLHWSPDGSQILFSASTQGQLWGSSASHVYSYTVASEGGIPKRILPEENRVQQNPDWSPDGKKIIFDSAEPKDPATVDLRILDLERRQVTVVPGSAGLVSPCWSPDGRYIAALFWDGSFLKIFDIQTQQWSALPVNGAAGWPAFSRDSHYIYYTYATLSHKSDWSIFRIPVKGGKAELVVDLRGWHAAEYWMNLDPTDAPLILRDIGSSDIYALTLEQK